MRTALCNLCVCFHYVNSGSKSSLAHPGAQWVISSCGALCVSLLAQNTSLRLCHVKQPLVNWVSFALTWPAVSNMPSVQGSSSTVRSTVNMNKKQHLLHMYHRSPFCFPVQCELPRHNWYTPGICMAMILKNKDRCFYPLTWSPQWLCAYRAVFLSVSFSTRPNYVPLFQVSFHAHFLLSKQSSNDVRLRSWLRIDRKAVREPCTRLSLTGRVFFYNSTPVLKSHVNPL